MSVGRRTARRQAVFFLYQQDLLRLPTEAALQRHEGTPLDPYASVLIEGVTLHLADLDSAVNHHLSGWTVDRLGVLERAILRIAAYELMFGTDVPSAVAIDEAVVLAKKFCSDEAGALVNGVLGTLARDVGLQPAADDPARERKVGKA